MSDPREDCESLAVPMSQFLGGTAAVPAFAGAALPFAETGPGAILAGTAAATGAYESVRDLVADNWNQVVCEPLSNAFTPQIDASQIDWNATDPFSSAASSPFEASFNEIMAPPVANVTIFDDVPSMVSSPTDFSSGGGFDSGSSTYDGGSSSGSGSSDSGGSSSSD